MALQSNTLSYFKELETLKGMDVDENKAFLDLLVYGVLADEEITDEELVQLDEELTRLPFLWDADARDAVIAHSADTREWLQEHIGNPNEMEKFLDDIANTINDGTRRLVALRMFAAVLLADGLDEIEEKRCRELGRVFGFDASEVDQVLEEVQQALGSESVEVKEEEW